MKKLITLLILFVGMVSSVMADTYTVYFKPNTTGDYSWKQGNERYAIRIQGDGNEDFWASMTETSSGSNIYTASYTTRANDNKMFICRMNGGSSTNSSENIWDQSGELAVPTSNIYYDKTNNGWKYGWVGNSTGMVTKVPSDYTSTNCYIAGDEFITNNYAYWDATSSNNQMTYNDDFTYSLTVTSNIIPSGSYEYKPVFDGNWIGNNVTIDLSGAGYGNGLYTISYSYNLVTQTATATATKNSSITNITYRFYLWDATGDITGHSGYSDNLMNVEETTATLSATSAANLTKDTKYKFKVVKAVVGDGTEYAYLWRNNSTDPAGDGSYAWVFTPTKTRAYDVTFTYDTDANTASAAGTIVGSIYFVLSEVSGTWTVGDMLTKDGSIHRGTINNWANKWFAIAHQDALNDACDEISDWTKVVRPNRANGGEINFDVDFENYTNEDVAYGSDGKVWYVSDGNNNNITISFNSSTSKWSINPYFTRNISAGYATFSSTYDVAVDGATAYYCTGVAGGELSMSEFTKGIPAGQGALLEGSGDVTFTPAASALVAPGTNWLKPGTGATVPQTDGSGNTNFILTNKTVSGSADLKFYKVNSAGNTVATGKAYLQIPSAYVGAHEYFWFEDETTGIESMKTAQKMNGEFFNLAGQRVAQPAKGLYIVNGKKVIMK